MADAMVQKLTQLGRDELVVRARSEVEALGQLYEMYYEPILRFCVHRLFNRAVAEDVASAVFLDVARKIGDFEGKREEDFRRWLYTIASNHANGYIRKSLRRKAIFAKAAASMAAMDSVDVSDSIELDWPSVYQAILKLNRREQTIVTLRFFEKLAFDEIGKIVGAKESSVRVTLHRSLKKLRNHLQTVFGGEI